MHDYYSILSSIQVTFLLCNNTLFRERISHQARRAICWAGSTGNVNKLFRLDVNCATDHMLRFPQAFSGVL